MTSESLTSLFFTDLKKYNATCFKKLTSDESVMTNSDILKAYSSVITRYFIFVEKHPELTVSECRILYYKLKIDMISKFFYEYPETNLDYLNGFKEELETYLKSKVESEVV